MKGAVAIGLVTAIAFLAEVLPPALGAPSNGGQSDPYSEIKRIRAQRHLRTNQVSHSLSEDAVEIPRELTPFVHGGEIPVYFDMADVEATGRLDYVLVVGTDPVDDKTMRIISTEPSGSLKLVLSRGNVTVCDECGGQDGSTSIGVGNGAIELINTSGNASLGQEITCLFRYSRESRRWLLVDRIDFGWDQSAEGEGRAPTSVVHQTASDFGAVSLAGADLVNYCQ